MTFSCREQVSLFLSSPLCHRSGKHEGDPTNGTFPWGWALYAEILACFPTQAPNSHVHSFILRGPWRAGGHCCHGFWKMWPQHSSSALVWRPRAGEVFQLGSVAQVASWIKALSSACLNIHLFAFPLQMSQSLP